MQELVQYYIETLMLLVVDVFVFAYFLVPIAYMGVLLFLHLAITIVSLGMNTKLDLVACPITVFCFLF